MYARACCDFSKKAWMDRVAFTGNGMVGAHLLEEGIHSALCCYLELTGESDSDLEYMETNHLLCMFSDKLESCGWYTALLEKVSGLRIPMTLSALDYVELLEVANDIVKTCDEKVMMDVYTILEDVATTLNMQIDVKSVSSLLPSNFLSMDMRTMCDVVKGIVAVQSRNCPPRTKFEELVAHILSGLDDEVTVHDIIDLLPDGFVDLKAAEQIEVVRNILQKQFIK